MRLRSAVVPFAIALIAWVGVATWQLTDMRAHVREHERQHADHGRALLDATESVVVRECRGGRAELVELGSALETTRAAFELDWIVVRGEDGETFAEAGSRPEPIDPRSLFEKRVAPLRPNPRGRGPPRAGNSPLVALPNLLVLTVAVSSSGRDARIAEDRTHAVVTTLALGVAVALIAGTFWGRSRSLVLRADLARSRAQLEGLETLRRLGAGLAHETRNPLGVVRGFAERLANRRIPAEDVPRAARAILEETDRTVARLDEFLLLSRPAALRRSRIAPRELFDELATLLRPDLDSAGATLVIRCHGTELDADRDQLRRLLMNLLLNAIHAVGPGGQIELACEQTQEASRIVVADDGAGVPKELRETIFEPYVTGRAGGTGLGLAIARRIALEHGFDLRYEPRAPRGTRMVLEVRNR